MSVKFIAHAPADAAEVGNSHRLRLDSGSTTPELRGGCISVLLNVAMK